jgi:hypothetical protein
VQCICKEKSKPRADGSKDVPETSSDEESEAEAEELELKRRATTSSVTKTREKWIEKTIFVEMQIGSHPLGSPYTHALQVG